MIAADTQEPTADILDTLINLQMHLLVIVVVGFVMLIALKVLRMRMMYAPARSTRTISPPADDEKAGQRRAEWKAYQERHQAVTDKWVPYLNDRDVFLALPAMRDMSVPEVGAFIDALSAADHARTPTIPRGYDGPISESSYARAVVKAETTFAAAKKVALHMREHQMSATERDELATARQLLDTAMNRAGSPNERRLAYRQASRILDRLGIDLPEPIHEQIETTVRALLDAPDPSTGESAPAAVRQGTQEPA